MCNVEFKENIQRFYVTLTFLDIAVKYRSYKLTYTAHIQYQRLKDKSRKLNMNITHKRVKVFIFIYFITKDQGYIN